MEMSVPSLRSVMSMSIMTGMWKKAGHSSVAPAGWYFSGCFGPVCGG